MKKVEIITLLEKMADNSFDCAEAIVENDVFKAKLYSECSAYRTAIRILTNAKFAQEMAEIYAD